MIDVICGAFVLTGILVGAKGWKSVIQARRSNQWPVIDGLVTESKLNEHDDHEGGKAFSCQIAYSYEVRGVSHVGTIIRAGVISSGSRQYAEHFVSKYKTGDRVPVSYDPGEPTISVIEPGIFFETFSNLLVGCVILLVGLLTEIHYWHSKP